MQTTVSTGPARRVGRGGLVRDGVLVTCALLMLLTLYLVFLWVPTDANLGVSQRILYFHVPLAILSLISIIVVAIASAVHLARKDEKSDAIAYASAEIGIVFCTLAIVTGAIWGKPVWGVWWTWDPKLTLTLVLWFVYAAYMMLRAYGPKGSQGARYGSVLALVGAIDAPIVYYAAELWRSTHPSHVIGVSAESGSLPTEMAIALVISLLTFSLLFAYLIIERYVLRRAETDIDELFRSFT